MFALADESGVRSSAIGQATRSVRGAAIREPRSNLVQDVHRGRSDAHGSAAIGAGLGSRSVRHAALLNQRRVEREQRVAADRAVGRPDADGGL